MWRSWSWLLTIALICLVALVGRRVEALAPAARPWEPWLGDIPRVAALAYLGYLVIVFVHELGHALVGTLRGLELTRFVVGPFMIDFGSGQPRFGGNPFRGYLDGAAEFDPVDDPASRIRDYAWMTAAGPFANLLLATLLLGLARLGTGPSAFEQPARYIGLFSGLVGLLNFVPLRAGPLRTDGAHLFLLLRGGPRRTQALAASRLYRYVLSPTEPCHYPMEVVRDAERIVAEWVRAGRSQDLGGLWPAASLLYYHYVDCGDRQLARELLETGVTAPRTKRQLRRGDFQFFDTVYAFHVALWDGDAALARAALDRVPRRAFVRTNSFWRGARAAVALAEGRSRDAIKEAAQARKLLARFGLRYGADRAEQGWLDLVVARAEASLRDASFLPVGESPTQSITDAVGEPAAPGSRVAAAD